MKKLITLVLIVAASAAWAQNKQAGPDTIQITLTNNIAFNWSTSQSRIVRDDAFTKLKANRKNIRAEMYTLMADETPTEVEACFKNGKMKKGDFAFNLFDALYNIPYSAAFKKQFDLIYPPCTVPAGVYDYVDVNRATIADQLKAYYAQ